MKGRRSGKQDGLHQELRALLNDWNPIGCPLPPDEYDCMIAPLLEKLQRGCNEEFVVRFLGDWTKDHLGLSGEPRLKSFARRVCAWYAKTADTR